MDFSTGCGKLWKIFTFDYHFRKKICYNIFFTKSVRFLFNIWLFLSIFFTGVASRFHSDFYGYNRYKIIFWAKTEHPFFVRFLAHITNEIIFCGFLSNNMIYMSIRMTHLMLRFWRIWRFWGKNDSDFFWFFWQDMFWYVKWAFWVQISWFLYKSAVGIKKPTNRLWDFRDSECCLFNRGNIRLVIYFELSIWFYCVKYITRWIIFSKSFPRLW